MLQFLADENFNDHIIDGISRISSATDIVRAREVGLTAAPDPAILEWAAQEARIVLTHDAKTLAPTAQERVEANLSMPGVFIVKRRISIRILAEEIVILAECSLPGEWEGQVRYLPML
jgi:hypothetical protein